MAEEILHTYSFSVAGPRNSEKTARAAVERAQQLGIEYIVVASTSGRTAFQVRGLCEELGYRGQLVVVTHHTGYSEPGEDELREEDRIRLTEAGCKVVTATHALSSISRSYRTKFGGINLLEIVAEAFRRFSQGIKAAIECAIMAADSGAVPVDEDIVSIAGTGKGADSAIVIRAANQNRFFDLKVREIVAMPR
ncbi:MAG: hypothetical protein GTO13_04600 [Proteobacteria bacterium]|nr:hypothetical protein [Pseudomonadota bacterium]